MARDLTPRPQRWLQWGERPVADRGGVQSHNLHLESHDLAGVSALGRMTGKGRISSFREEGGKVWNRRIPLVAARPAKIGLLKRERLLSVVGGNASSCPIPAVDRGHPDRLRRVVRELSRFSPTVMAPA
jgi:hypothetical protein